MKCMRWSSSWSWSPPWRRRLPCGCFCPATPRHCARAPELHPLRQESGPAQRLQLGGALAGQEGDAVEEVLKGDDSHQVGAVKNGDDGEAAVGEGLEGGGQ